MSTEATITPTQGAFAKLAKAAGLATATDPHEAAAEAIAKVLEEHGDAANLILSTVYAPDEIAKDTDTGDTDDDGAAELETRFAAIESKLDQLLAAKPAETVAKSGEDTAAEKLTATLAPPKSAAVRETLLKAGVPGPMVEALGPALESSDPAAATAARDTLAKMAGVTDLANLLKEQGTTDAGKPPAASAELTEDEKKACAMAVSGR